MIVAPPETAGDGPPEVGVGWLRIALIICIIFSAEFAPCVPEPCWLFEWLGEKLEGGGFGGCNVKWNYSSQLFSFQLVSISVQTMNAT